MAGTGTVPWGLSSDLPVRALLLLFVPLAVAAQSVQPFTEVATEGRGLCVERAAERVCWQSVGEDGDGRIEARRNDGTVRWDTEPLGAQSGLRAFRVRLGEGMGLVVALRTAVSNGIGVETWTLVVLPDDASAPTVRFEARDIGADGAPLATWRGETVYWATDWQDADDPSGRRGNGFTFVGRPFVLGHDGLVPVTTLPIRSRRMLYDFRQEPGGPVAWLADRRAETRRRDPFWDGRPSGERGEIVEAGEGDAYAYPLAVRVGGQRRTVEVGGLEGVRLGDAATGRLFPAVYRPADLVGRRVRVGARVVWLD